ncbi:hypothetical protein CI610_03256 [invertebrate metagenome]|uniref:Endonuclease/exonuclease/phosphatase domain-containing protein n=1 Tax=invertebrate metagenome TaxID=1711999 RepID=A0A2H9T3K9_9ZZZZ
MQLNISGRSILYGTFYRSPDAPVSSWDHIAHSIDLAFSTGITNIIVTGDFNANLLSDTNHCLHLRNLLSTLNLTQSVASPTFFTESSSSLLDIICASDPFLVNMCHVGENFLDQPIRYHCPVYGTLNISKPLKSNFKRKVWLYDLGNYDKYRDRLSNVDWDSTLDSNDIDISTEQFTRYLLTIANECIPNKDIIVRANDAVWMNGAIRKLIRRRKYIHRKAKQSQNADDWSNFRKARNMCVNAIRKYKRDYFNKLCTKLNHTNTSSKEWWKIVNHFMSNSSKKTHIPPISYNGNFIHDDLDKANAFNTFFSSHSNINDTNVDPPDLQKSHNHTLSDIVISQQDVLDVIHSLDCKKSFWP